MPQPAVRLIRNVALAASVAAAALCASTTLVSAPQTPQTSPQPAPNVPPPVTFTVETSYVDVDAVVTDRDGNVVRGLSKDDFELFEDGKPQRIDMFTYVDIPSVAHDRFLAANRPISSDVKTN